MKKAAAAFTIPFARRSSAFSRGHIRTWVATTARMLHERPTRRTSPALDCDDPYYGVMTEGRNSATHPQLVPDWAMCMYSGTPPLQIPEVPFPKLAPKAEALSRQDITLHSSLAEVIELASTDDPFLSDTDRGHLIEMKVSLHHPMAEELSGKTLEWRESAVRWWLGELLKRRKKLATNDGEARKTVNRGWMGRGYVLVIRNFSLSVTTERFGDTDADPLLKAMLPLNNLVEPEFRVYQRRTINGSAFSNEGIVGEVLDFLRDRACAVGMKNLLDFGTSSHLILPHSNWKDVYRQLASAAACVVAVMGDKEVGPGLGYEIDFLLEAGMADKCIFVQSAQPGERLAHIAANAPGARPTTISYGGQGSLPLLWREIASTMP